MNYHIFLLIAVTVLLIISICNLLRFRNICSELKRQQKILTDKNRSVIAEYQKLKETISRDRSFSDNLCEADETITRLKMSRSSYHSKVSTASIPERYRYFSSLSDQGADAGKIAKLFSISKNESDQMIALSRLKSVCKPY